MYDSEVYESVLPGRRFCLSKGDLDAYSDLLLAAYPDMRFFRASSEELEDRRQPPVLRFHDNLKSAEYGRLDILFSPEHWDPQWEIDKYTKRWSTEMTPRPNGVITGSGETGIAQNHGQPFIGDGDIYFRCRKGDKDDMRVARKCLRLLTTVASNKGQVVVAFPSMEVLWNAPNDLWIGHGAREWLLADPRRITRYNGGNVDEAVRPLEL